MSKTGADMDSESRFEFLYRDLKRKEKEITGYKGMIGKLQAELEDSKRKQAPETPPEAVIKPTEAPKDHIVHPWDTECKDCGGTNPEFIDETMCDPKAGGCGKHLGAIKYAKLIPECPDCHSKKFVPLRPLTDEEKRLFEH